MRGLPLRVKVFFLFAGAALLIVVPALLLIAQAVEDRVYERATGELAAADATLRFAWEKRGEDLLRDVAELAERDDLAAAWEAGETSRLRRLLRSGRGVKQPPLVLALDSLRTPLFGPELAPEALLEAELRGPVLASSPDTAPPLRVAVAPVQGDSGLLGYVGVATVVDSEELRAIRKAQLQRTDLALFVGNGLAGITVPGAIRRDTADRSERVAAGVRDSLAQVLAGNREQVTVGRGDSLQSYRVRALELDRRGPVRAILFSPVKDELDIARGIRQSLFGIGFAALLLALLLAALVARIVARPAQALAEASARLARGDYRAPLPRDSGDEIGQLARAFGEMRSSIAEREQRLRSAQAEMIHREKLAAMGRLVAQLSHEINNPIYNIQNCLEALERRGDPADPNREFLELAQEELARMAALTRQLLDQGRPQSDAAAPVSLNAIVKRVLTLAGDELRGRGVRVETELPGDLPLVVAHPEAVHQVLANLVANAGDAMPGGGVLRIATRADAESVYVVVEDTGSGIPEEHLPHIFEAFYTTKPGVTGLGLGLFVSEGIIRGHRGRLSVESTPGEGSRFTVRLPRRTLDEAPAGEETGAREEAAAGV